ncbi:glutaredoxin-C1-like [Elaeis guineensis]|uniref:glutaredoxin-C1-like n=1 Tax=Elaeis guineensis var. tenera TaxID=51953 RepID=UPI003C6CC909
MIEEQVGHACNSASRERFSPLPSLQEIISNNHLGLCKQVTSCPPQPKALLSILLCSSVKHYSVLCTTIHRPHKFASRIGMETIRTRTTQPPVAIFSNSSCCLCHTIKRLLYELGVNPTIYELDEEREGRKIEKVLVHLLGRNPAVPAVFIGGKLVGSADRIMSLHLSGDLVPLLRNAGAFSP